MSLSQFDRNQPLNGLPALPPAADVETSAILRKTITASRALAELKGMAERMPNQAMLIDSLVLQEARASSEIENILTTNDELFKACLDGYVKNIIFFLTCFDDMFVFKTCPIQILKNKP
jgi:hypothetical protein